MKSDAFLPTSAKEMKRRGWDNCDIVIVTPDAYIDHPSFGMAVLGRFLESHGFRVGILSQPRWKDSDSFMEFGRPNLAFAVSGGAMDSMVINYTAVGIPRKDDPYCDGADPYFSKKGDAKRYRIRPDRTVQVYCSQIRAACKGTPIIIGGIEASLRRIAHYDWWSDTVRRSILFDSKADLLIHGMGEYPLLEAVSALRNGAILADQQIPGTAVALRGTDDLSSPVELPSYEEARTNKESFARAYCDFEKLNRSRIIIQKQDTRYLVQFPASPLTTEELDAVYDLPYTRMPHPKYHDVPAYRMIRDSVTAHRGCYGNCAFCAITSHQGPDIVSRSKNSIEREIRSITKVPGFGGTITDIGGPSANMYGSQCIIGGCITHDCLKDGSGCKNLLPGIRDYQTLLDTAAECPGVRHVFIGSGLRFESPVLPEYFLRKILKENISGNMKVAPESGSDRVLRHMHKSPTSVFGEFHHLYERICREEKVSRRLVPYIIVGHPGENEEDIYRTRDFLNHYCLYGNQFQIFTPSPLTRSTAMYYLGYDPCTEEPVEVVRDRRELEKRKNILTRRNR
ncbi:YgiQ family radical SAM protein [Methanomicrobiaceae archaeon CYW5]|uniref:YgiQ family radical SAM protein n=1 Tax=Methanovulcanius yangii TaxID=1789227 RepID=UPI0029C9B84D|nr:YgiQ family radical SAM protein [Methanovulcanius yangii]MBT8507233.1 YgiQ family radical SAM protein [Methanovulcanius yangii]